MEIIHIRASENKRKTARDEVISDSNGNDSSIIHEIIVKCFQRKTKCDLHFK